MKKPKLIGGPYRCPRVKKDQIIACLAHGEVVCAGIREGMLSTDDGAPLAWPVREFSASNQHALILCADLIRAVKTESAQAVAHYWGVSRWTVSRWRRVLGAGRMTRGTRAVWAALADQRLSPAARVAGGKAAAAKLRSTRRPKHEV
jgi:hypothetical protein